MSEESEQATEQKDKLLEAAEAHEHDDVDIISVPRGRALICHVCEGPLAKETEDY